MLPRAAKFICKLKIVNINIVKSRQQLLVTNQYNIIYNYVRSYLKQPWFEIMIDEDVKSQDLKELATIVRPSAWSTRLIGVHQVRVCSD